MKVIASLIDNTQVGPDRAAPAPKPDYAGRARDLEAAGCARVSSSEVNCDPFLPLALAASATQRVELMTSIAVAFARTPMALATVAHDLNTMSDGRFVLGLGSQVKAHIERRFGMPWSAPAARMKEFIQALHAIWDSWHSGEKLDFRGRFYTHTLMTPRFVPEDLSCGKPRIALAAVGPMMTDVAASVADAMICHAFTTRRYIEEVTLPAIETALKASGRDRSGFELIYPPFIALARSEEELETAKRTLRQQIAFYASTPSYRPVLEVHGWGELQTDLQAYVKAGRWAEMGDLIDDSVLDTFAFYGSAQEIGRKLGQLSGLADSVGLSAAGMTAEEVGVIVQAVRNACPDALAEPR